MKVAVGKYRAVEQKNGCLGRSGRHYVVDDTGIYCLAFCKQRELWEDGWNLIPLRQGVVFTKSEADS